MKQIQKSNLLQFVAPHPTRNERRKKGARKRNSSLAVMPSPRVEVSQEQLQAEFGAFLNEIRNNPNNIFARLCRAFAAQKKVESATTAGELA